MRCGTASIGAASAVCTCVYMCVHVCLCVPLCVHACLPVCLHACACVVMRVSANGFGVPKCWLPLPPQPFPTPFSSPSPPPPLRPLGWLSVDPLPPPPPLRPLGWLSVDPLPCSRCYCHPSMLVVHEAVCVGMTLQQGHPPRGPYPHPPAAVAVGRAPALSPRLTHNLGSPRLTHDQRCLWPMSATPGRCCAAAIRQRWLKGRCVCGWAPGAGCSSVDGRQAQAVAGRVGAWRGL